MFSPQRVVQEHFVEELRKGYRSTFGGLKSNYCDIIAWAANTAMEIIGNSNALYHNSEHTVLVSLVGQAIMKGKHIKEGGISCEIWLNCIISLLFHDIGYVRGLCRNDNEEKRRYATGRKKNEVVQLGEGCTDASLAPFHVDRGKLFIEERFGGHSIINSEMVKQNIELTRFPIPKSREGSSNFTYPELIRAADLIGQLGDVRYIQKCACLYYEFEEIGANKKFNYKSPEDLVHSYPKFFWNSVYKHIQPCIKYLRQTQEGNSYLSSLYANVFRVEHESMLRVKTDNLGRRVTVVKSPVSKLDDDEGRKKKKVLKKKKRKKTPRKKKDDNTFFIKDPGNEEVTVTSTIQYGGLRTKSEVKKKEEVLVEEIDEEKLELKDFVDEGIDDEDVKEI